MGVRRQFTIVDGWLEPVRRLCSPNCDARPPGVEVDLIVIHGISLPAGEYGGPWIEALFMNELEAERRPAFRELVDVRVSAHLLVRRDGEIIQFVPFHLRAWHAGDSCHEGRARCNDFSVGIELEGCDEDPYDERQYEVLSSVIAVLVATYPGIGRERIVGHSNIAPGRKTDPGPAFDWRRLSALLDAH